MTEPVVTPFGTLPDGREAHLFVFRNPNGTTLKFTNYGLLVTELHTRDRHGQLLDRTVHLEQQGALAVFAHQALGPEKRGVARTAGHGVDFMQAGAGVQHHIAGGQLDLGGAGDLGAGEKERGTLETLLICPISRVSIVLGKFFTVLTTGLVGALITVGSFGIWGAVIGSFAGMAVVQEAMSAIAITELVLIFSLLLPISAVFAALLLAISIYARTFKEAQNYISPLSIMIFLPLVAAMMPGVELNTKTALVPIMNVALAIKELIKGTADYMMLALIFGSTLLLAAAAIGFCVHWFQQEKVLFR